VDLSNYFYFGKIIKPKGYKGELKIYLDVDDPLQYEHLDAVLVKRKKSMIPYLIQHIQIDGNKASVKFEDVEEEADAAALSGSELYLPVELLKPLEGNKFYYHEITGFRVKDKKIGDAGYITGVMDLPSNPLFEIRFRDKDILVPITDEIIIHLDRTKRELHLDIPEGLIDIFFET
jgi:16S rRNA processing protein RimM